MKRLIITCCAALVMAWGLVGLVGCATDASQEIRDDISYQLGGLKNHDQIAINDLLSNIPGNAVDILREVGVNPDEYIDAYLDGFDYTIGNIQVKGNEATVELTLKYKDPKQVSDAIQKSVSDLLGSGGYFNLFGSSSSQDEEAAADASLGSRIMGAIESVQNTDVKNVTVTFEKKDGQWVPSSDFDELISGAMFQ